MTGLDIEFRMAQWLGLAQDKSVCEPPRLMTVVHEAWGWRRMCPPVILGALVVVPAWWWIARDHGVWPWDTAHMGTYTLNLWSAFNPFSPAWWRDMLTGMTGKAPGLPWVSQPFAGLGELLFGDPLTGLLVFQSFVQVVTAGLVFRTARHVTGGRSMVAWLAAGVLIAAPLSMGLSVRYYTEPLQTLAVAYVWWAVITIPREQLARRVCHVLISGALGSITKISTPLYVVVPVAWLIVDTARMIRANGWRSEANQNSRPRILACVALLGAALALTWLALGYEPLIAFVRSTSSGVIASYYGESMPFLSKLGLWLRAIERELLSRYVLGALGVCLVAHLVMRSRVPREADDATTPSTRSAFWCAMVMIQLGVVLAVMALQINQDVRYLAPLLPGLAIVGAIVLNRVRPVALAGLPLAVCFVQYLVVVLQLHGAVNLPFLRGRAQLQPPVAENGGQARLDHTVTELRRHGGPGRTYLVAVDVLNFNTNALELHTARQRLRGEAPIHFRAGFSPLFADFDYALSRLFSGENNGVITVPPAEVPPPAGMENQLHPRMFTLLTSDPRIVPVTAPALAPVRLFTFASNLQTAVPAIISSCSQRGTTDHLVVDELGGPPTKPPARDRGVFTVSRSGRVSLHGWAYAEATRPPPADAFLELTGAGDQRWFVRLTRGSRPDVAAHFGQPHLETAGFAASLEPADLAPGTYRLRILQIAGDTLWEPATAIYWLELQ